jgi:hypothetical protein
MHYVVIFSSLGMPWLGFRRGKHNIMAEQLPKKLQWKPWGVPKSTVPADHQEAALHLYMKD